MKKLTLKTENTKAYKKGYALWNEDFNPYAGIDNIDALRFEQGRRQHIIEEEKHDSA